MSFSSTSSTETKSSIFNDENPMFLTPLQEIEHKQQLLIRRIKNWQEVYTDNPTRFKELVGKKVIPSQEQINNELNELTEQIEDLKENKSHKSRIIADPPVPINPVPITTKEETI